MGLSFHLGVGQRSRGWRASPQKRSRMRNNDSKWVQEVITHIRRTIPDMFWWGKGERGQIRSGLGPTQSINTDPRLIVSWGERACVCGSLNRVRWTGSSSAVEGGKRPQKTSANAGTRVCARLRLRFGDVSFGTAGGFFSRDKMYLRTAAPARISTRGGWIKGVRASQQTRHLNTHK